MSCLACARRGLLLEALAPWLDRARVPAAGLLDLMALENGRMVAALGAEEHPRVVTAMRPEAARAALARAAKVGLEPVCGHAEARWPALLVCVQV